MAYKSLSDQNSGGGGGNTGTNTSVTVFPATASSTSGLTFYSLYAGGGAVTFHLPATPATNQTIGICDAGLTAASGTITIDGNGKTICAYGGTGSSIGIVSNGGSVILTWDGIQWTQFA